MLDHIGLRTSDLARSKRFYQAALEPLGYLASSEGSDYVGFGPDGAARFWLHAVAQPVAGSAHVAFVAASRDAVGRFHRAGLATGARDNGAPGLRPDYGEGYYAAFLIDPDGNNIEAVHLGV